MSDDGSAMQPEPQESLPEGRSGITRRDVLVGGAALGGSLAIGTQISSADSAEDPPDMMPLAGGIGVVSRIIGPETLVMRTARKRVRVRVGSGVPVCRTGAIRLLDLLPGERITVEGGIDEDGVMIASRIQVLFELQRAEVLERDGDRLITDAGRIRLEPSTDSRAGEAFGYPATTIAPAAIAAGDQLVVQTRFDPVTGDDVALIVAELGSRPVRD